jgi:hypothetical protein
MAILVIHWCWEEQANLYSKSIMLECSRSEYNHFVHLVLSSPAGYHISQEVFLCSVRPVSVKRVMEEFSRMTIISIVLVCEMIYPLSMHRVITQFHRFLYIFNCCMLVVQLCLKIVSTYLSSRVMWVSFIGLRADPRSWGWS